MKVVTPKWYDLVGQRSTGLRSNVVCQLRWEWEAQIPLDDAQVSIFVVPRRYVKGRKQERIIICNSVAQEIIDRQRGNHDGRLRLEAIKQEGQGSSRNRLIYWH